MSLFELLYCCLLIFTFLVIGLCLWQEKRAKISPTPTLPWIKKNALDLLNRHTAPENSYKIAELGSGWGGVLISFVKMYPKAQITGFEISFWPYWTSKLRTFLHRKKVTINQSDFFKSDLSQYDILFCYLSPWHMKALKTQLETLKKGSIVVSNAFFIPDWVPVETKVSRGLPKIPVYIYIIQ